MTDFSLVQQTTDFTLDDRPLVRHLEEMREYCLRIPSVGYAQQPQVLRVEASAQTGARFGKAMAISADGNFLVAGAPERQLGNGEKRGAVYVFRRMGLDWELMAEIGAPAADDCGFGFSLALDHVGDTLIVGAPFSKSGTGVSDAGLVYVFDRVGIQWSLSSSLQAGPDHINTNCQFGYSVCISADGKSTMVGLPMAAESSGRVCGFERNGNDWKNKAVFGTRDVQEGSWFGLSVSLAPDGNTLAIGACKDSVAGESSGSAYIYKRAKSDDDWSLPTIHIPGFRQFGLFGHVICLHPEGNLLAVTEFSDQEGLVIRNVHLYESNEGKWVQRQTLSDFSEGFDPDVGAGATAVGPCSLTFSADGKLLAVGTPDMNGTRAGVRLYQRTAGSWMLIQTWLDPMANALGASVAINNAQPMVVAGAPLQEGGALHTWSVADQSDIVFGSGLQPGVLAVQYAHPELANGDMQPHQALLLAYLRMLETPRQLLNDLPAQHRQLYYRDLLGVRERTKAPDRVPVSFQLSASAGELLLPAATLLDGGQDAMGNPRQYALEQPLLANQSRWTDLRMCWPGPLPLAPRGGGAGRLTRILFDEANGVAWPIGGARLFDGDATQIGDTDGSLQAAVTGRVVASPMLAMSGGARVITVKFSGSIVPDDLDASISSEEGWLPLTKVAGKDEVDTISLGLPAEAAASGAPQGLDGFCDEAPLLRLRHLAGGEVPTIATLAVHVAQGNVLYATDEGPAEIMAPSHPFRHEPVIGAGFNLVSPDWCNKAYPITVTLTPHWADLPTSRFNYWYANYLTRIPADNSAFKVRASMMTRGGRIDGAPVPMFAKEEVEEADPVPVPLVIVINNLPAMPVDSSDPRDWLAWVRIELSDRDFLHKQYWPSVAKTPTINLPYTPQWSALDIAYSVDAMAPSQQYLLTPFGYRNAQPGDAAGTVKGRLAVRGEAGDIHDADASLYVGLAGIAPGQDLSLYWQLRSPCPQDLTWEYLGRDNAWKALAVSVNDQTGALFYPGKWACVLPNDAATEAARGHATEMPAGRAWLRGRFAVPATSGAADDQGISSYPWLFGLHANAGMAVLHAPELVDASHFYTGLPANVITQSVEAIEGLAQVLQPWPSSGARPPESPENFNARVAGRLKNRNRVLTWLDVGVLLKERFPEVHDVRVPSTTAQEARSRRAGEAAGALGLVVIPAHGKADNADPLRPRFDAARLQRMRAHLEGLASAWCVFETVNPRYVDVDVSYQVDFADGINPDYGCRQLKADLQARYMPWSLAQGGAAVPGDRLDYYDMVAFIQQRSDVLALRSLTLARKIAEHSGDIVAAARPAANDESVTAQADEVLVLVWS